jgi:ribosomal protein S17
VFDNIVGIYGIGVNVLMFVYDLPRYEKRHKNIPAHVSPCFRVSEGDTVVIGQCRYARVRVSHQLLPPPII